jgi:Neuraminidase (sialidase)
VLDFDVSGNAYLVNLSLFGGYSAVISKSTDGGATWQLETNIFLIPPDKPWLAIDRSDSSPYKGNVYLPFVNVFEGPVLATFDSNLNETSQVQAGPLNEHQPGIAIRKDGEVFMSTVDWGGNPNIIYMAQYTNGGTTLVHKTALDTFPNYVNASTDFHTNFQPTVYTAIDNSGGPYDGRLYVAYTASKQPNPSIFDVFVMYSDDGGLNWSDPEPVHGTGTQGTQQFYSSLYVNNQGVLVIDWYDRRNYPPPASTPIFTWGSPTMGGIVFQRSS